MISEYVFKKLDLASIFLFRGISTFVPVESLLLLLPCSFFKFLNLIPWAKALVLRKMLADQSLQY